VVSVKRVVDSIALDVLLRPALAAFFDRVRGSHELEKRGMLKKRVV
jgi:hypothetical protein